MLLGVLSGLLCFVGLLLVIANLVYVGYIWEKGYYLPWCTYTCETDYIFYGIFSTMCLMGIFMIPPANLFTVPVVLIAILGLLGMIGLVKLGSKLAHVGFSIKTKKEDE
jgi:hypothetical protein